ncbi:MAG TPA: hypothetical protein PKY82_09475 [Pyrinomonadaceae bacterium]|nr:hypothetical protein [Pyrinomonadaceae bacterium]
MEKPKLFCEIGDKLKFIVEINSQNIKKGDVYKTIDLIGYGWDLERMEGNGTQQIRILNSEIKNYVTILE